jgi:hypothetical protein
MRISISRTVVNKATNNQMGALTRGFRNVDLSAEELLNEVILKGNTYCIAELKKDKKGNYIKNIKGFLSCSLISVDVDNQINDQVSKETRCKFDEEGYVGYDEIICNPYITKHASFIYQTPSCTEAWNRYRIAFELESPITDPKKVKRLSKILANKFDGDKFTSCVSQMFYGSLDAKHAFYGNILSDNEVEKLLESEELDSITPKPQQNARQTVNKKPDFDKNDFSKEELEKIIEFIFKRGKIDNDRWYKTVVILKNLEILSESEIKSIISRSVELGDIESHFTQAYKYKDLSIGSLIFFARENGYELPQRILEKERELKFWKVSYEDIKKGDEKLTKVIANSQLTDISNFLNKNGYWGYNTNGNQDFVHINNLNQVKFVSKEEIFSFLLEYIELNDHLFDNKFESKSVEEDLRKNVRKIETSVINLLKDYSKHINQKEIRDDKDFSYVFYRNGVLKIDSLGKTLVSYSDLDGYVWEEKILERDYVEIKEKSKFETFVEKICTSIDEFDKEEFKNENFKSAKSILGYLLSKRKIKSDAYAVILCDDNKNDFAEGGRGKTIFANALGLLRNKQLIGGRLFKAENQFNFSTITKHTDIIHIDDIPTTFNFSLLYDSITGPLTLEMKYKSQVQIPFEDSPKFCITTNSVVQCEGNSHERRVWEFEFSNYFLIKKLKTEFDGDIFDMTVEEFHRFDTFMTDCIQYYMMVGKIDCEFSSLNDNKLKANIEETLLEYITNYIEYDKTYIFKEVLQDYNEFSGSTITPKSLTLALERYAKHFQSKYFSEMDRSLGSKLFMICTNSKKEKVWWKSDECTSVKKGKSGETRPSKMFKDNIDNILDNGEDSKNRKKLF